MFSHWAAGANRHGYSVAVVGYRLCPEVGVANIVEDAHNAALLLHRSFGKRLVACGHSAGGHLVSTLVATNWQASSASVPSDLVRKGISISGVFDLAPLIETEMNEQLRLDVEVAHAVSPIFWPVSADVRFEAWVGGDESSEFLRQSRIVVERWGAAGAKTRYEAIAGANHFTSPAGLADPASPIVAALVALAAATKA
jgi:arylformamidase